MWLGYEEMTEDVKNAYSWNIVQGIRFNQLIRVITNAIIKTLKCKQSVF